MALEKASKIKSNIMLYQIQKQQSEVVIHEDPTEQDEGSKLPPTTTFITKVGPTEEELSDPYEEVVEIQDETIEDKDDPNKVKSDGKVAEACEILE